MNHFISRQMITYGNIRSVIHAYYAHHYSCFFLQEEQLIIKKKQPPCFSHKAVIS